MEDAGAGEDVQVGDSMSSEVHISFRNDDDEDDECGVFSEKVWLKVAVIKETRRLLPNFHITYTIAATVILNFFAISLFNFFKKKNYEKKIETET